MWLRQAERIYREPLRSICIAEAVTHLSDERLAEVASMVDHQHNRFEARFGRLLFVT